MEKSYKALQDTISYDDQISQLRQQFEQIKDNTTGHLTSSWELGQVL